MVTLVTLASTRRSWSIVDGVYPHGTKTPNTPLSLPVLAAFAGFAAHCALVVLPWEMRAVKSAVDLRSAVADSNDPGTSSSQRGHRELFSSPNFLKENQFW